MCDGPPICWGKNKILGIYKIFAYIKNIILALQAVTFSLPNLIIQSIASERARVMVQPLYCNHQNMCFHSKPDDLEALGEPPLDVVDEVVHR